jgi:phenylpropionate dioxygenase-like ring-hydroxylating dioxygenase large terminal subunit
MDRLAWMTNVDPALSFCWHPVAMSSDVGTHPVPVTLIGRSWTLRRAGPAVVADPEPGGIAEHFGLVWLAPEMPITPLPDLPEWETEGFEAVAVPPSDWKATAAQMADNFLDVAHFPFTHVATIGDPDDRVVAPYTVERDGWRFSVVHEHTAKALGDSMNAGEQFSLERRRMIFEATAPHHVRLRIEYLDSGVVLVITFFHQPIDETTTRLWVWNIRNDLADGRCTPEETIAFQLAVGNEDRALLEKFTVKSVPIDPTFEVHTRADRITLELRRMLSDLVVGTGVNSVRPAVSAPEDGIESGRAGSWHQVALSENVPEDEPVGVQVMGEPWVLARLSGRLVAFKDLCPHRLAPLSAGRVVDGTLQCPYHGYRFDAGGGCVEIPAMSPDAAIPPKARCTVAADVVESRGRIWVAAPI